MKRILLTLDDKDFKKLLKIKESVSGALDKSMSWEKLILYLMNNQK